MPSLFTKPARSGTTDHISRRHTREPISSALFSHAAGRIKIAFVGMAAGAGATTLSFTAAEYLTALQAGRKAAAGPGPGRPVRSVTMLELDLRPETPAGKPYDKIGIDRRFAGRDFISLYRLAAEGRPLHSLKNLDGGISWVLRLPGEPVPAQDPTVLHRLVNNAAGDVIICDISATGILNDGGARANRDVLLALLADMGHIVCVIDPLPSRLLASIPATETCRAAAAAGVPVTYVFNKLNPGVNLREVTRFTGIKDYLPFPAVPAESVYGAEYACRSLAPELAPALSDLFQV